MAKSDVFRAVRPLFIGVFRAHNPGDVVDGDRVEKYGWQADVEPVKDQAHAEQQGAKKS